MSTMRILLQADDVSAASLYPEVCGSCRKCPSWSDALWADGVHDAVLATCSNSEGAMLEIIAQRQGFNIDKWEAYYVRYYISNGTDTITVEFNLPDGEDPFVIGDRYVEPARNILNDVTVNKGWDVTKLKELKMPVGMAGVRCRIVPTIHSKMER